MTILKQAIVLITTIALRIGWEPYNIVFKSQTIASFEQKCLTWHVVQVIFLFANHSLINRQQYHLPTFLLSLRPNRARFLQNLYKRSRFSRLLNSCIHLWSSSILNHGCNHFLPPYVFHKVFSNASRGGKWEELYITDPLHWGKTVCSEGGSCHVEGQGTFQGTAIWDEWSKEERSWTTVPGAALSSR